MEKLSVRRTRAYMLDRYQNVNKTEKTTGTVKAQPSKAGQAADMVSETLEKLMGRMDKVRQQAKEGRRTLHTGEAALAEVEDALGRMEELARRAASDGGTDRSALQSQLERLRGEIDRIVQSGVREGLFQDGEGAQGADALVDALLNGLEAQQTGTRSLPAWLLKGMEGPVPSRETLLAALGVDRTAGGAELLAALGNLPLEDSAAGYLAGLYLGAVISGGVPDGSIDAEQAAQGLERLLELVSEGVSPDEAVELLTGGVFTSMEDFQAQFTGGTAPGLEAFLTGLLLTEGTDQTAALAALLAGGGAGELDLLMALESALEGSGLPDGAAPENIGEAAYREADRPTQAAPRGESVRMGAVQASGRDLSGVSLHPENGTVSVGGGADVTLRGQGQERSNIRLTGSGTVTLHGINAVLTAEAPEVKVVLAGENRLGQVALGKGTVLTLEGCGQTQIDALRGEGGGVLRLTGGAFVLPEKGSEDLAGLAAVVVDGPVSLAAAGELMVQNAQGQRLTPLDIVWKTMLPGWSTLTSLMVDGKQRQLILRAEDHREPLRLWLLRGNETQGFSAHSVMLQGRDKAGNIRVRYAYVRWDERTKTFQETVMYPNPFVVTGGEPETDWRYEEESQTLSILSSQVTAVSGGTGTDGDEQPFSGRLALSDGIGRVELTLEGVECRVPAGRAFRLGKGNDVTLLLQCGSENIFESGPGFAGISLGAGTSLTIDRIKGRPEGRLTALGGAGGAGIGKDSGAGQERCGAILIRGGIVTATGIGGGAGIGGALGAKAGDIRIQGGTVTAQASCCAAAIGAGIQGGCGDITITSFAHVEKARGGGPDGDIGGCLFGNCGKLQVSSGADLGGAKLWSQQGLSLQVGETALTMPRFRVSAQALRLDAVDLSTRESARSALAVLASGRRWVGRLQEAYGMMYGQLSQSVSGLYSTQQYVGVVREEQIADLLLNDARVVLRQDPLAPYRLRAMENVGMLLR